MERITRISKDGITYALFVHGKPVTDAVRFLGDQKDDMQVGVMERPAGHKVKPHTHPPVERTLTSTCEFLSIEKGKIQVQVFDDAWNQIADETFSAGDFLVFYRGGHALTMLEPTRMIEVKQGPYAGDQASKSFKL